MQLPNDPVMLLSLINTNLRDHFASLDQLCDEEGIEKAAIVEKLAAIDYYYEADVNQFR